MQVKIESLTMEVSKYKAMHEQADKRAEEWKQMVGDLMPERPRSS